MERNKHVDSGFFVIRTPIFPISKIIDFEIKLNKNHDIETYNKSYSDRLSSIRSLIRESEIQEALWIAAPDFYNRLSSSKDFDGDITNAFYRYLARMSFRCTPFGLFSGIGLGKIHEAVENEHQFCFDTIDEVRHIRLNVGVLYDLINKGIAEKEIRKQLYYSKNASLFIKGNNYRYLATRLEDGILHYDILSIEITDYLTSVLEAAENKVSIASLISHVILKVPSISESEAESYIDELIDNQILVPTAIPKITGADPLKTAIRDLDPIPGARVLSSKLKDIKAILELPEVRSGSENAIAVYERVSEITKSVEIQYKPEYLLHTDLIRQPSNALISKNISTSILRAIYALNRVQQNDSEEFLKNFRENFVERYDRQEVPLAEIIDDQFDINILGREAVAEPLLNEIRTSPHKELGTQEWSQIYLDLLNQIVEKCIVEKSKIDLDAILRSSNIPENDRQLPDNFFALISICNAQNDPAELPIVRFKYANGPSAATMLGRFCYADDKLKTNLKNHIEFEESQCKDAIYAEIIHLPVGRVKNITLRPELRDYEIPVPNPGNATSNYQIPIADLLVSVVDKEIILRSKRLNRRVLPRLSCAHDFKAEGNVGVYRWLCALQAQRISSPILWSWGPLSGMKWLPRVSYKNVIVSPEQWHMSWSDISRLKKLKGYARFAELQNYISINEICRYIVIQDADQELPFDLSDTFAVEALFDLISSRRNGVQLKEMLPYPRVNDIRHEFYKYSNEIIIPYQKC